MKVLICVVVFLAAASSALPQPTGSPSSSQERKVEALAIGMTRGKQDRLPPVVDLAFVSRVSH